MTVNQEINRAYPPIYRVCKVLRDDTAGRFLAVIIPGSSQRPHFAGKSYVRVGPRTEEASEAQFNVLIAERTAKAYKIREWIGKEIAFARFQQGILMSWRAELRGCTQHYATVVVHWNSASTSKAISYPLNRIEISFNDEMECLQLEVRDVPSHQAIPCYSHILSPGSLFCYSIILRRTYARADERDVRPAYVPLPGIGSDRQLFYARSGETARCRPASSPAEESIRVWFGAAVPRPDGLFSA